MSDGGLRPDLDSGGQTPIFSCTRNESVTISQPVLEIRYDAEDFPASTNVPNGTDKLAVTWDEILWAAMTIGRPNLYYVFQHGRASILEAVFRLSLTRMALEQHGPSTRDLRRIADRAVQRRILTRVSRLADEPRPSDASKLKGHAEIWRIRVGDWRVCYQVRDRLLLVLVVVVGRCGSVYERLRRRLR